jgi:hypothetical protein
MPRRWCASDRTRPFGSQFAEASLLWRLRRATAIDTGLLQLQSEIIGEVRRLQAPQAGVNKHFSSGTVICSGGRRSSHQSDQSDLAPGNNRSDSTVSYIARNDSDDAGETSDTSNTEIARCFLRLANLDNGAFERANRYETALWRQIGQILLTLDFLLRTGN